MNRRRFLAALASIPFLRRWVPKPEIITVPHGGTITTPWIKFPMANDPRFYGGMRLVVGSNQAGTVNMEVSQDGKSWRPS